MADVDDLDDFEEAELLMVDPDDPPRGELIEFPLRPLLDAEDESA